MKKALLKDSIKEIKNTYKRFISILLMAFLGVGFFAGIRATSPDMVETIDKYYDNQNVYDIQILSTLGLTNDDIVEITKLDNINKVEGVYEKDGKINIENNELVVKTITLGDINTPIILSGNSPKSETECLVEEEFLKANKKELGDKIYIDIEKQTNDEGEEIEYLKCNELTIVGTVQSPLYISRDRGSSNLGAGKVNYYVYISKNNINATDIYTNIYVQTVDGKGYTTSTDEYEAYIENVKNEIEGIKEEREEARYNKIVEKAQTKLDDAEKELNTQKEKAEKEIKKAEDELKNARNKIKNSETEITTNEEKANEQFKILEEQLNNAKQELENQEKAFDGQEIPERVKKQLEQSKIELENKTKEFEAQKEKTYAEINNAKQRIKSAKQEISKGETELQESRQEFNKKISEAENKLLDARENISKIEKATWYILDRNSNAGYVGFIQDSDSIENIGKVFPVVFFVVALLISLTSMTRMVEEQRMQLRNVESIRVQWSSNNNEICYICGISMPYRWNSWNVCRFCTIT